MANVLSFVSFARKRKEAAALEEAKDALEEAKAKDALVKAVIKGLDTEGFVTKAELEALEAKLNAEMARIHAEMAELRAAVAAVERYALLTAIALNCLVAVAVKLGG